MKRRWGVVLLSGLLVASCGDGNRQLSEADKSAFGTYVDSLDSDVQGTWFTRMGMVDEADSMLIYLRRELPQNGLDTTAFFVPQIAEDMAIVKTLAFDSIGQSINEVLKRLDDHLTQAYVSYTTGLRYGFMQPDKVLNRLDNKVGGEGFARLFDYEVKTADDTEAQQKLATGERMAYLKASQTDNYVYQALKNQLAKTTDKLERRKIAINMERCRWQMKHPERQEKCVLVNIAAQHLWAVGGDSVLDMKICCGAFATKTPLLHSAISHIQVNPEWVIPFNIIKTDVAHHSGDSVYFARNKYSIVERESNDTLNAANVSKEKLLSGNVRVVQKGGAGNSLGRIVFRFPNNFSVYLHDTNNRGAFQRDKRTLSHGCVRIQKPFDMACFLLPELDEWTKDKLRLSMDIRPETEQGRAYQNAHAGEPVRLVKYLDVSPKVPVYIVYYTAYPNPATGKVELWPDIYKYDEAIEKEIGTFLIK